jgi:hypothetical protein
MAASAAAVGTVSRFTSTYVPMGWMAGQLPMFGSTADYWIDGNQAQAITIGLVWKDGAADEEISPGRYSHALVRNADLPRAPKSGDAVARDGVKYDVVRVFAYEYRFCTIVLQEAGDIVQPTLLTWDQIPGTWDSIPGTFDSAGG